eukprot:14145641-Heterocapsa_arctica.AAC.1
MESSLQSPPSSPRELSLSVQRLLDNSDIHNILLRSLGDTTPDFKKFVLENESVLKMRCSAALNKWLEETQ